MRHKILDARHLIFSKSALQALSGVAILTVIGALVLSAGRAATPFVTAEPEGGTVTGPAATIGDTAASGGQAIRFGTSTGGGLPSAPPVVCGTSALNGPSTAPAGAITVPAGDNSTLALNWTPNGFSTASKIFWFAPGVHTLGTGQFDQIGPGNNSTFIGAPGAILDGQSKNEVAFGGQSTNVTIKYLTIRNFVGPNDQGTVNHDQGTAWAVSYNTVTNNKGAGVFAADNNVISYNCITANGQYGFQAYKGTDFGPTNILFDHNEISFNNTDDVEKSNPGCGCSGGGKFWNASNVTYSNNYVHDNNGSGTWADTNNRNFLFKSNWFENNKDEGLFYELSYNVAVRDNVFKHNVNGTDPYGYDRSALGFSEVSGDSRVPYSLVGSPINDVSGNLFENNADGFRIWENADRFCNSPVNSSSGYCTLVNPTVVNLGTCNATHIASEPYYTDCRWWASNTKVHNNTFISRTGATDLNGIYSNYGTTPSWSPYMGSKVIDQMIKPGNNVFSNNTYKGSWQFLHGTYSPNFTYAQWQAKGQDAGSTYTP